MRFVLVVIAFIVGWVGPAAAAGDDTVLAARAAALAERVNPCVVGIGFNKTDDLSTQFNGSGFVVDARAGLVVTAAHLVKGRSSVWVTDAEGTVRTARVLGASDQTEVALLYVRNEWGCALDYAPADPEIGAEVYAFPFRGEAPLARHGTITGKPIKQAIQLSFVLGSRASGAPIVDVDGRVVGMAMALRNKKGPTIDFGVPLQLIQRSVAAMRKRAE